MRNREQTVVHFAGGGGSCTGAEQALGESPDHAINHDAAALGMHRTNHPRTQHHIEDVFDVDPEEMKRTGGPIGLAWFSPDCKHFSKAKGGKPLDKRIRGLILVMLRWAKAQTRVMFMENVEEIQTWGPLVEMWKNGVPGWYPDPEHKGRTWQAFLDCMGQGIRADHPDLPFILEVLAGTVTAEDCIRGFGYAFEFRELRACDYGAPTIRKRLFAIFRRDGQPITWPQTTHADPATLQAGDTRQPWHTIAECIDWHLPTPSIFLRGQAAKKARCKRPLAKPTLRRIAKGIDRYVMRSASPYIVSVNRPNGGLCEYRGSLLTEHAQASNQRNMPVDEPMRTACAGVKGGHFALLTGTLVQTGYGEREGQQPRALDPQQPLGTVVSGGGKHALAAASLVKLRGTNVGDKADAPMHTASAGGNHHGIVAAYLAQHNGGFNAVDGRGADEPVSTISSRGSQQQLVTASMAAYYGSESDGQAVDEPGRTSTTKPRLGLIETTSVQPMTAAQEASARRVAKFLRAHGVQFEGEFATVGGFVIVDIGMRMLTPRELFRAQGFPEGYIIDRATLFDPQTGETITRALTKEEQIRMCGNSVCPPVAAALIRANCPEMVHRTRSRWHTSEEERRAA